MQTTVTLHHLIDADIHVDHNPEGGFTTLDVETADVELQLFLDATTAQRLRDQAQIAVDALVGVPYVPSAVYKILLDTRPGPGEIAAAYAQWNRVVEATAHAYGVNGLELFAQLKASAIARV